MSKGYCYAYRSAWSHPLFKDLLDAAIWNFLYQNAFYEDGDRNFNGTVFHLKRGQIVVSIPFLAKGFNASEKRIRRLLEGLTKDKQIAVKKTSKGSVITVCNYNKYQENKNTQGKQRASKGQAKDHNKNKGSNELKNKDNIHRPADVSIQVWNDFVSHRKKVKAQLTQTALNGIIKQAEKANWSLEDALTETCTRGWKSFKAEWVQTKQEQKGNSADDELSRFLDEM